MEDNPYSKFVSLFQPSDNRLSLFRGKVIKIVPLTIDAAGITLSGNELMVNAELLERDISISDISGSISTDSSELTITDGEVEAKCMPNISAGDTVLLLTLDQQLFYVLCKVVSSE